ncbi:MAG: S8 family serine peptidase [Faecousia sp.]
MKQRFWTRCLSLLLVACLILGLMPAAYAADKTVTFEEIPASEVPASLMLEGNQAAIEETEKPDPDEIVRVSIVLEKAPVLDKGYSTMGLAANGAAQTYRESLLADQQAVQTRISKAIGSELDVAWNLTLAGNIISANIRYGDLEKIAATRGVSQVVLETKYEPCETEEGTAQPNNGTSTVMTGASTVWASGYTGAGSRIAIIDTGLDTDHEAVDNGAYLYALESNAKAAGMTTEDYMASLNLLDEDEIAAVLPQLNIYKGYNDVDGNFKKDETLTADVLNLNDKIPFAYNYIDRDLDVTHDNDQQGGHGSHVAGIAAANRYVPEGEDYVPSMESTFMVGAAPDAQLIVMKVFGKDGGAYDSDYMAAIEDAILLDCDVVNLSLGSANPGFTTNAYYQKIMDKLAECDTVVSMSAGNNGAWPEYSANGYLYAEDVNLHTGGSPGAYTNAFTVASVDNAGMTGYCFQAAGRDVVYTETGIYNSKFVTLDTSEDGSGTEQPYVFLDSLGYPEDYEGINVTGKIVFISRGISSFSEKLTNADKAGAAACVIYNNVPGGAINMDLSQSYARIPCVGITKADADAIRAASTPVKDDEGNVLYYTGTLTVGNKIGTSINLSQDNVYTMSAFSSWGVPSNLNLKPEITAPGGNIYSIDGATTKTNQYVIMSGTSMAAPHNAGLVALLCQYFQETGLPEKLGVSPRTLAQSLLMSTATPILDEISGLPYPVIQQGSGLGNVNDAMNASSYVMVEGQPDGKVKAELGDDPDRTGVYTFDYTLYNLTDADQKYTLNTDVYTQDYAQFYLENYGEEDWYTDYTLTKLSAVTTYCVNGKEVLPEAGELTGLDFNGDGKINEADAQAILDYAVGKLDSLANQDKADLNEDGKITAYDAELFLSRLGKHTVTLPANGEVTVTVTITLPDSVKEELDKIFTNGAYIEAYVYATPFATEEGVLASAHSIPVLAFYGGWDEPNMFDRVTHTELATGTNEKYSYIPGASDNNYVAVSHVNDDPHNLYYLGGNPYAEDDEYLPERNAIRSNAGDAITALNFCLIRAAGGLRSAITNVDTGEIYAYEEFDHVYPAFFFSNYGSWQNYSQSVVPGVADDEDWMVTDKEGNPLPEGTTVELMVQAAPEYYLNDDNATINWDEIDPENTTLSLQVTVDNTAPELKELSVISVTDPDTGKFQGDFVEAVVQDNQYVAALLLMTPGGTKVIARQSANQTVKGVESRIRLDYTGAFGSTFKLAVVDYAGNATYYNVNVSEPFTGPTATLMGSTQVFAGGQWQRFSSDANFDCETLYSPGITIAGAAYGDGYLFYSATELRGYQSVPCIFVVDYPSFENPVKIGKVSGSPWYDATVQNLCYNTDDQSLYLIRGGQLVNVDVATGKETVVAYIDTDLDLSGLDYSETEHCFYVVGAEYAYDFEAQQFACPTGLYTFALPEESQDITLTQVADFGIWPAIGSKLALDEKQNAAYILRGGNLEDDLFTYEFETKTLTQTGKLDSHGSMFLEPDPDEANSITRDEPTSLALSADAMNLFVDGQKSLVAEVSPWCLKDKSVVWTSSDPAVAAVDENGTITGLKEGTVTITAASKLDASINATCTVTVIGSSFTIRAVGNNKGESTLFTYDLNAGKATDKIAVTDENGKALPVENASLDSTGKLWVQDNVADETGKGYRLHTIDTATGKATFISPENTNNYAAGSMLFSDLAVDDTQNVIMAVNGEQPIFFSENPEKNDIGTSWFKNISSEGFVGMAAGETWNYYGSNYTRFYALDAAGQIITCDLSYSTWFGGWTITMAYYEFDKEMTFTADENGVYQDTLVYNADTDTPILFHYTEDATQVYALSLDKATESVSPILLGEIKGFDTVAAYEIVYTGAAQETAAPTVDTQAQQILLTTAEETIPMGTTNVSTGSPVKQDDGIVSVAIRAEEDAASGMLEIALDENATLVGLESAVLSSYTEKDGNVTFAYADYDTIAKGETVAVLRVKLNDSKSTVTLTETERSGKALEEKTTLILRNCDGKTDCPSAAFSDLNTGAWYHEYTDFVLENGLMNGMGGGKFAPNGTVTRAMAVTMLYRLAGEPEVKSAAPFTDVADGKYYTKAVAWAYENGIVKGMTDKLFAPNADATREQLVTFLYRYAQFAGMDTSAKADLSTFADGTSVSNFAVDAMTWAVGAGLVEGMGNNKLAPKANAVRVQLAALIYRFVK